MFIYVVCKASWWYDTTPPPYTHTHTHVHTQPSSSSNDRFFGMRVGPRCLHTHTHTHTHTCSSSYHTHPPPHMPGSSGCAMVLDACSNMPQLSHLDLSSNGVGGDGRSYRLFYPMLSLFYSILGLF